MKLGIAYNIFNGDELLEDSLKRIRPLSDYIVLVYQEISNVGNQSDNIKSNIDKIDKGLYDEIVCKNPDLTLHPQQLETIKRETGRLCCKEFGCTHYMSIDCDEFYKEDEFIKAKEFIIEHDLGSTACVYKNYFHNSSNQIIEQQIGYVPFIAKITDVGHVYGSQFIVPVDPTRIVPNQIQCCFNHEDLMMHHMSYVRKDYKSIESKLMNSPNKYLFERNIDNYLEYYDTWDNSKPALNPHQFKNINSYVRNVVIVDDPINISISYKR